MIYPDMDANDPTLAYDIQKNQAQGNATRTPSSLFKPKPDKAGQKYTNRIFIPMISPHTQKGFEVYPPNYRSFYLKVHGHYVTTQDGEKKRAKFVICKKAQNKYISEGLLRQSGAKQFDDDRCASCEAAQVAWEEWNQAWAAIGYPSQEARRALPKEDYQRLSKENPSILMARDLAVSHGVKEKYIMPVVNMEESELRIQWIYAAGSIFEGLIEIFKAGVKFYSLAPDPHVPGAIIGHVIALTKDTKDGLRNAEYKVMDERGAVSFSQETIDFLMNPANYPSIAETMEVLDYDTHLALLSGGVVDQEEAPYDNAPPPVEQYVASAPETITPQFAPAASTPVAATPKPAAAAAAPVPKLSAPALARPMPTASPVPAPAVTSSKPALAAAAAPKPALAPAPAPSAAPKPRPAPTVAPAGAAPAPGAARKVW